MTVAELITVLNGWLCRLLPDEARRDRLTADLAAAADGTPVGAGACRRIEAVARRHCSHPATVAGVAGWLLGDTAGHLSDVVHRDRRRQWWTVDRPPGGSSSTRAPAATGRAPPSCPTCRPVRPTRG